MTLIPFLLFFFSASTAHAAPWPAHAKHATHRVRYIGRRAVQLDTYHPKSTYNVYGTEGIAQDPSFLKAPINDSAIAFVQSHLNIDPAKVAYRSGYLQDSRKYAYVKQSHDGVPFANAVANIAWNNGKVVAFGSSFVDTSNIAPSTPTLALPALIPQVESALDASYTGHPPTLEYLARPDGAVALTHVLQLRNEDAGTWLEAYVCAHSGAVLSVTDFVAHASYTVLPITKQAFPEGLETLVDPADLLASPFGWHSDGVDNSTSTIGNNAQASTNRTPTTQSTPGLNFLSAYTDTRDPTARANVRAATTNAFYLANAVHDVAYRYGFTEEAFNFQESNFGKGGRGGDGVRVAVQDASGVNNANFATPPDGQPGVCRMFIWDQTSPRRDGTMETDIVVHELTHGITNRMTGGGSARCLQTAEAGGMGEGWSDAMAEWVSQTSATVEDFVVGQYVLGSEGKGIRTFPYSTNPKTNPLRYSSLQALSEVHSIGEVWANMLHNVYAALVGARGFSAAALTAPDGAEGNVVFMRLFMDALALQPCNPTFVAARDAWIQADENRYSGANKCTLFAAFASRGLGLGAGADFVDDGGVPLGC